ncbi:hypothetical protein EP232_02295 [bacterium]|nr:MAG: hypothetical protein EP232_02295 [bacterium]
MAKIRTLATIPWLIAVVVILTLPLSTSGKSQQQSLQKGHLEIPFGWKASEAADPVVSRLMVMRKDLEKDPTLQVKVTGHTDTFGSNRENQAIGYYYAQTVARQLESDFGFDRTRIVIISAGETEPLIGHGSSNEQTPNRRVVIALNKQGSEVIDPTPKIDSRDKRVLIMEPSPGNVNRAYQRVKAIVDGDSSTALLTINGVSSLIAVQDARVESEVVLNNGENIIEIMAWDRSGQFGRDSVKVVYIPPPPQVELFHPTDGNVFNTTLSPVVKVRGRVLSTSPLKETFLFLNGSPRRINVQPGGNFNQSVVLIQEINSMKIEALDLFGKTATSPEISVGTVNMSPKEMVVFLTWDKPDVDLDLHVWGPERKHTFYGALDPYESTQAIPGAALDLDDKDGFGPEVFTFADGLEGVYTIGARYHHSFEGEPCQAQITVVLHPAEPARRITRIFGPYTLAPGGQESWMAARISMPDGTFLTQ